MKTDFEIFCKYTDARFYDRESFLSGKEDLMNLVIALFGDSYRLTYGIDGMKQIKEYEKLLIDFLNNPDESLFEARKKECKIFVDEVKSKIEKVKDDLVRIASAQKVIDKLSDDELKDLDWYIQYNRDYDHFPPLERKLNDGCKAFLEKYVGGE